MKIICFGDSNTYGYDPRSYFGGRYTPENRWVDILGDMLGYEMINAGENGRTIPQKEAEVRLFLQLVENSRSADLVIIMLGTNDLLQEIPVDIVAERMESFLQRIDHVKSKIFLIAPPPMKLGEWVPSQSYIHASNELAFLYKALAERLGVRFAEGGKWGVDLAFDGVHFAPDGHRVFAEGLYYCLSKGE